jgi:hypothetical protein
MAKAMSHEDKELDGLELLHIAKLFRDNGLKGEIYANDYNHPDYIDFDYVKFGESIIDELEGVDIKALYSYDKMDMKDPPNGRKF